MNTHIGFLFIHGMGDIKKGYSKQLSRYIQEDLGDTAYQVAFEEVHYSPIYQLEEDALNDRYDQYRPKLRGLPTRRFLISALGDAGSLLNMRNRTLYITTQRFINDALGRLREKVGRDGKIFVVAHSLGCQVFSNYMWDAQKGIGIFDKDSKHYNPVALHADSRGSEIDKFITMGCNIPLFSAGIENKVSFNPPNERFTWINYYDPTDVLGYPLRPMGGFYEGAVTDIKVKVGNFLLRQTPYSHVCYWKDRKMAKRLVIDTLTK
jgi:hypothetical protein